MRVALVCLVVGFAVGLLVGWQSSHAETRARSGHAVPEIRSPSVTHDRTSESRSAPDASAAPDRRSRQTEPLPTVSHDGPGRVTVTAGVGAAPDGIEPQFFERMGRLVLDNTDGPYRNFAMHGLNIQGQSATFEDGIDAREVQTLTVAAGEYLIRWADESGARVWQQQTVRVESGNTTRLSLAAFTGVPPGQGKLEFLATGLGGAPLESVEVQVEGLSVNEMDSVHMNTGPDGRAETTLRPGRYRVQVGQDVRWVDVVAGDVARLDFMHTGFGALRIELSGGGRCYLVRNGRPVSSVLRRDKSVRSLLFLKPGTYDVYWHPRANRVIPRPLGTVTIRAGLETRIVPELPEGKVHVTLNFPKRHTRPEPRAYSVALIPMGAKVGDQYNSTAAEPRRMVAFSRIAPGAYRMQAVSKGCHVVEQTVTVGSGTVNLNVTFLVDASLEGKWPLAYQR